jgi:hypothetical protein
MVRVLMATSETQGLRASDFSWVPDGELLCWGFACDRDRDNIDGGCGCCRSLSGVFSRRATTTFKVSEIDGDAETLYCLYERSYHKAGFPLTADDIRALCAEMLEVAVRYPLGTILEKRGEAIQPRRRRPRSMWDEED